MKPSKRLRREHRWDKAELREYMLSRCKINHKTGCWEWQARLSGTCKTIYRYGRIQIQGRDYMATAISLWAFTDRCKVMTGNGGKSLHHLHTCDNTRCINPKHLYLGTQRDNTNDCVKRGRHHQKQQTHCIHGHEFTPENTKISTDGKKRSCRTCQRHMARKRLGITPDRWRIAA
jgi:hypothetical protein